MNQNIYIQNGVLVIFSKIKKKLRRLKSMRMQLFIILLFIGIVPMVLLSRMIISNYMEQAVIQRKSVLTHHSNVISNLLLSSGFFANTEAPETLEADMEISYVADIYGGRIIVVDHNLKIVRDTYNLEAGKILISEEAIKCLKGSSNTQVYQEQKFIELTNPIVNSTTKEVEGAVIMSFSLSDIHNIYMGINQKIIIIILVLAIIVLIFAIFYSSTMTKPFKRISHSIDRLTEGYMDEISIKGFSEIESISDSFNQMIGRLQKLEASRQEFVSNVSHELKTPITSMKVLADSLLDQKDAPAEIYREFMVDITDEIERENKIINDLLSLVKMDKTSGEMNISSININELLEQILKRLRPIAAKRNIELVYESFRPVLAEVDEVKLSLAVNNLIENAIKYNYDDGWVHVSLNADHKFFYIKVSDSGVGIPEEEQDSIFERFYRVDKARSRETGGTGLGLSITRNAILMHRGAIKVYSKEKEGTTFTVRIPLSYIA